MKLLVLDGNSILNRSFYGIRTLSNKDGQHTNAIYGFLTTLNKLNTEVEPDAVAIAFDMRAPTFRHKAYDGYKAKRKGMPEELASQLPILKDLLRFLGYRLVECKGFEADDILGTLAKSASDNKDQCIIATGDRDSLQLVNPNVTVRITSTKLGKSQVTLYDEQTIEEVYGVVPKELIEIKAIQGDTSDNIPGVPGIGEKGASELIKKFHNIDYIYQNIDSIDVKESIRKKLIAGKDFAFMSKMLGTIRTDAPIETNVQEYVVRNSDFESARLLMTKLELFSLIDKLIVQDEKVSDPVCKERVEAGMFLCEDKVYYLDQIDEVRNILEDQSLEKQTHDAKLLFRECYKKNIKICGVSFDTLLAAYLLEPSAKDYSIELLLEEHGVKSFKDLVDVLRKKIEENNQLELLCDIEIPLSKVLAEMEIVGFLVDADGIKNYGELLNEKLKVLQKEIYEYVGYEFNVNSPQQLGQALFEKLGLPAGKKIKTGYSTSASVLEKLKYMHPAVDLVLDYRAFSKLKSTYCDGMLKVISDDGRVHSNFNQTETRTGRISSTEPNLQNIPVRTELGREMRKFFCAKEGCVLVDADYSQIELRILACIAKDENMINAFKEGVDIHTVTASEVFKIPKSMITPVMRTRAKAVNFGIVYGISAFSLAKDIGVTRKEAQEYIDNYFNHYKKIKEYLDDVVRNAKENGYVETLFGRRRYIPELSASNFNLRAFGERVAMNMPIQGTSADIIKLAMIKVYDRLKKENLKSKLILQVHDELIVESPEQEAEYVKKILQEEMENCVKLSVPLTAKASVGKTWFETKD